MAHRPLIRIAITATRVFGRAFAEAWRQAAAAQKAAKASGGSNPSTSAFASARHSGLTLDEACKILNVPPPKDGAANMAAVTERFKKLFDLNEPGKGGSFYLQSKILRARERIEAEVRDAGDAAEAKKEAEEGWKPKVYKDR